MSLEEKKKATAKIAGIIDKNDYMQGIIEDTVKDEIELLGPVVKVQCLLTMLTVSEFEVKESEILGQIVLNLSVFDEQNVRYQQDEQHQRKRRPGDLGD